MNSMINLLFRKINKQYLENRRINYLVANDLFQYFIDLYTFLFSFIRFELNKIQIIELIYSTINNIIATNNKTYLY